MTLTRTEVARLLRDHGIMPSRALGQNFVADPNTVRRIARLAAVGHGDWVVEVGAGLGSLTLALMETGANVVAVERDRWLVPLLRQTVAMDKPEGVDGSVVEVVEADAMSLDWPRLLERAPAWALVANLPYNIATPLLADLLDEVPAVARMLVMVQEEVGRRLVARPGDPFYGAVSVKVAYWARAALVGTVPSSVFVPKPRVGSALVELKRLDVPAVDVETVSSAEIFSLVRLGFAQRRKMLRSALAGAGLPARVFAEAGVPPEARAEQLSVYDWGRLAAAAAGRLGRGSYVEGGSEE